MDLKAKYTADPNKSKSGVPIKIGDAVFDLCYAGSTKSTLLLHSKTKELAATMEHGDAVLEAMHYILINYIVIGWKGLKENKKTIKYSSDTLARLLKQYVGFDLELYEKACDIENYQADIQDKTEKN